MNSAEAVKKAVAELDGTFWHGRRIGVVERHGQGANAPGRTERSAPNSSAEPTRYLFIGNIPYEATDAQLNKMFRELENVEDVRVAVDRVTGWPRGFAHADFVSVEAAVNAHQKLNGFELNGRPLRCDYATAPSEERRSRAPRNDRNDRNKRNFNRDDRKDDSEF
jgi:nucleolin